MVEAERSLYLLSASWGARIAGGITQYKFRGLRIWKADDVSLHLSLKAQEAGVDVQGQEKMAVSVQTDRGQILPSSAFLFYLGSD